MDFPCYPVQTPACSWVDPKFCHHIAKIFSSPLISNSHCGVLSYHKFLPCGVGVLNSRHSLFYPLSPHAPPHPLGPICKSLFIYWNFSLCDGIVLWTSYVDTNKALPFWFRGTAQLMFFLPFPKIPPEIQENSGAFRAALG